MEVQVGPSAITIHADDEVVVCEPDTKMSSTKEQGYFARDTRFISGYRLKLGRTAPVLLNSAAVQPYSSRFEFTNPELISITGVTEPETLHLRVDRIVGHGVHEDYDVVNYGRDPVAIDLEVSVESDFADLFDVKRHQVVRRGMLQSVWDEEHGRLTTTYRHGAFERGLSLQVDKNASPAEFANGGILFRLELEPRQAWHACLLWIPIVGGEPARRPPQKCNDILGLDSGHVQARRRWVERSTHIETSEPTVTAVLVQAVDDLASLRMHMHDELAAAGHEPASDDEDDVDSWVPAAGVPWFVSLFGRDSLVVSLQTLALSPRFAQGSLHALAHFQADAYDDARDMQPGKIEHEIRQGELAFFHMVPHTPYYGTHEATTFYVWAAAQTWRWNGDRGVLDYVRPHVERALSWIDTDGDIDGDGLQEYKTRAGAGGYYNQGWKDSGDGIVNGDGSPASLPIALCEHQAYVVAAKRAWADVIEDVYGDKAAAARLRDEAGRLADLLEERFWWEDEGTYYLGLDGDKRPIESVTSNPGHLLWANAVVPERAERVCRRLLADDLWSGWGIRTLSDGHPAYNPFSYQLGSVWPHDNAICAAGFRNYGLDAEAARVARAIFEAADRFQSRRLPELFSGLARDPGGFPVQYLGANVPQAWAAGSVVHLITALLGIEADAPHHRVVLRPGLPGWLDEVALANLRVGDAVVDLRVRRLVGGGHGLDVEQVIGDLEIALEEG
ncbi:MAG: amylo-alpha,6-glucosidase [Acidimicrobiales bacterium]|nr:amylo-alpha,6-glucosidase [Acidimicrobiales bacterium]